MLATEIPTVANGGISADGMTYTFKIRQGVKFHNGDPLTPHDVAFYFPALHPAGWQPAAPAWILSNLSWVRRYTNHQLDRPLWQTGSTIRPACRRLTRPNLKQPAPQVTSAITADDTANTVTLKLAQPWGSVAGLHG